jgi:hypothetical protein
MKFYKCFWVFLCKKHDNSFCNLLVSVYSVLKIQLHLPAALKFACISSNIVKCSDKTSNINMLYVIMFWK